MMFSSLIYVAIFMLEPWKPLNSPLDLSCIVIYSLLVDNIIKY